MDSNIVGYRDILRKPLMSFACRHLFFSRSHPLVVTLSLHTYMHIHILNIHRINPYPHTQDLPEKMNRAISREVGRGMAGTAPKRLDENDERCWKLFGNGSPETH